MKAFIKKFIGKLFSPIDYNRSLLVSISKNVEKTRILVEKKDDTLDDPLVEVDNLVREVDLLVNRLSIKTIVEAGSRDAQVSITLSRYFPDAKLFAFECNPQAIEICKKNILGKKNIHLIEKAISDNCGHIDFYSVDLEASPSKNLGGSSLYQINPDYPYDNIVQRKITVEAVTLTSWKHSQNIDTIDILWMDLQGAELKALHGLGEGIRKVKFIYTEVSFMEIYNNQPLFDDLNQYLSNNGFLLLRKMYVDKDGWGNMLYVHKSLMS